MSGGWPYDHAGCAISQALGPLGYACRKAAALLRGVRTEGGFRFLALVRTMTFAGALGGLLGGVGRGWSVQFMIRRSVRSWIAGDPVHPGSAGNGSEAVLLLMLGCRAGVRQ